MKVIDGLTYREWQKRNTLLFSELNSHQQKQARFEGYKNVGWSCVQKSWDILNTFSKTTSLFDKKLENGDLLGAVNYSLMEVEQTQNLVRDTLQELDRNYDRLHNLAREALSKYKIL